MIKVIIVALAVVAILAGVYVFTDVLDNIVGTQTETVAPVVAPVAPVVAPVAPVVAPVAPAATK